MSGKEWHRGWACSRYEGVGRNWAYHIIWCSIISYYIISYHIIWCNIISYLLIWYCVISYHIIFFDVLSFSWHRSSITHHLNAHLLAFVLRYIDNFYRKVNSSLEAHNSLLLTFRWFLFYFIFGGESRCKGTGSWDSWFISLQGTRITEWRKSDSRRWDK